MAACLVMLGIVGCSGSSTNAPPLPTATPSPVPVSTQTPAPTSTTLAVSSTSAQPLPAVNGGTASVSLAVPAGATTTATIMVAASASAPSGSIALAAAARAPRAISRTTLAYYAFVPSADIQLASFPAITLAFPTSVLPAGTVLHEAFLDPSTTPPAYVFDLAIGTSASGGTTFAPTASVPKLLAGKAYIFAFYSESVSNATATPVPSPSPSAVVSPTPLASATPKSTPTPSPVPASSSSGFISGSATFSPSNATYNGLTSPISPLSTTETGGMGNETFVSIPPGQPSGNGSDPAHPYRSIVLEVNDSKPLSNSTTYMASAVLLTYREDFLSGSTNAGRSWISTGGTITFENVDTTMATYRIRGATMVPDTAYTSNSAVGAFTLDAVGTAKPFTQ